MQNTVLKKILWAGGILLFLFAFGVIQFYIWSDLFETELDTDNAETVLWAQASIDSGSPVNPDFFYDNVLIPLGGHLLFVPFVKAFGVGMPAMRCGSCLYSCLFVLLLVLLFRNFGFASGADLWASGLLLLFTVAPEPLRDIFWAHVVYYGMSILFMMAVFNSFAIWLKHPEKRINLFLLLAAFLLGCCNGAVIQLFVSLPFICAVIFEILTQKNPVQKKNIYLIGTLSLTYIAGLLLHKLLISGQETAYHDVFTVISSSGEWTQNPGRFLSAWIGLFTVLPTENTAFFSAVGIKLVLRIAVALSVFVMTAMSFKLVQQTESKLVRVFIFYQWLSFLAILFFYIFGNIAANIRRLMPAWFNIFILDALLVKDCFQRKSDSTLLTKTLVCGLCCLWGCCALMNGASVLRQKVDYSHWYGQGTILKTLYDHGLTHGYSTYFWGTNSITVLTDNEVTPRIVSIKDHGFSVPHKVNDPSWYKYDPDSGRTYLVCLEREFYENPWLEENAVEVYRTTQTMSYHQNQPYLEETVGCFILVYDHDVIAEYLQTDPDGLEKSKEL